CLRDAGVQLQCGARLAVVIKASLVPAGNPCGISQIQSKVLLASTQADRRVDSNRRGRYEKRTARQKTYNKTLDMTCRFRISTSQSVQKILLAHKRHRIHLRIVGKRASLIPYREARRFF